MKNTFNLFTCANFNPYLKIITCRGLHSNNYAHCAIVRFPQESVAKERLLKLLRSVYFSSQSVSIGTRADCGAAGLKNVSHISCHPHIHALIMYIAYMYIRPMSRGYVGGKYPAQNLGNVLVPTFTKRESGRL